jgi:hypothetical protein
MIEYREFIFIEKSPQDITQKYQLIKTKSKHSVNSRNKRSSLLYSVLSATFAHILELI